VETGRSPGAADHAEEGRRREHARLGSGAMREVVPLSPEASARRLKDGTPSAACSPIASDPTEGDLYGFITFTESQLNWNHLIGVLVIS
jgi:hypothetical protein